jgi:O-acetyl-ADP-ribose deacetylase (regulator of RNase III)
MPFLIVQEDSIQAEAVVVLRKNGFCGVENVVKMPAFRRPARYMIYAAGPAWEGGKQGEEERLSGVYRDIMKKAAEHQLASLAFPLLAAEKFPKDLAAKAAVRAVREFLAEQEMMIYLMMPDRSGLPVSEELSAAVKEYLDGHYGWQNGENLSPPSMLNDAAAVADENEGTKTFYRISQRSLEQRMRENSETFSQMLLRLIDEKGWKDSYVYKKANVDRRHFSKIRNDPDYAPNKKTVLAFAIALELSMDETKDLLMRAGFAFSCCSKFDVILCYFIENRRYDMYEINEMLFAYDLPLLGE